MSLRLLCLTAVFVLPACTLFEGSPVPPSPPSAPALAQAESTAYLERLFERDEQGDIERFRPLYEARAAVSEAAADDAVNRHASKSLAQAQAALETAESGWSNIAADPLADRKRLIQVRHQSYRAQRLAQIALAEGGREVSLDTLAQVHNSQQRQRQEDQEWLDSQVVPGRLGDIGFAVGTARLTEDSMPVVRKLDQLLEAYPRYGYVIAGHTDNAPPSTPNLQRFLDANPRIGERNPSAQARAAAYNRDMSRRRAETVKQSLVDLGTDPERLQVKAYGQSRPIASNDTAAGRRENRRVEVTVKVLDGQDEQAR